MDSAQSGAILRFIMSGINKIKLTKLIFIIICLETKIIRAVLKGNGYVVEVVDFNSDDMGLRGRLDISCPHAGQE
jgi:hypothetical protein